MPDLPPCTSAHPMRLPDSLPWIPQLNRRRGRPNDRCRSAVSRAAPEHLTPRVPPEARDEAAEAREAAPAGAPEPQPDRARSVEPSLAGHAAGSPAFCPGRLLQSRGSVRDAERDAETIDA